MSGSKASDLFGSEIQPLSYNHRDADTYATLHFSTTPSTFGEQWSQQIGAMFSRAAKDSLVTAEAWQREVAAYSQPSTKKTEIIAMRDGTPLTTDL